MTYTEPHYYLTFGGSQFGSQEIWQTGVRFAQTLAQTAPAAVLQEQLNNFISVQNCLNAAKTLISNPSVLMWPLSVKVFWAKVAVIKEDGKYYSDAKVAEDSGATGSAGAFAYPPQLASVVSLWSGSTLGRANHGRCYLPVPHTWMLPLNPQDALTTQAQADKLRDLFKTMLHSCETNISTVVVPAHAAIMSSLGSGTSKAVAQIGCGRVIDTIRRRRNALDDAASYAAY